MKNYEIVILLLVVLWFGFVMGIVFGGDIIENAIERDVQKHGYYKISNTKRLYGKIKVLKFDKEGDYNVEEN